ncbi:hypothetical protein [Xylocopilactobacillus apis]|uniref:Uncharacterized protein n=1 Tax=Xylocopilactobacillus apis TaxID=2932183 RepID=A0AAU9D208_9LACO|nr:hypothetical protein [Xylocopilactobacillus apis]BDR56516.1 hypothetical protein KIMC2_10780 [Xylocopilactobacillus apis]
MFAQFFSSKTRSNSNYRNRKGLTKGMRAKKTVWVSTPMSMRSVSFTSNVSSSDRPVKMPK